MKKLILILPLILTGYFIFTGQKSGDDVKKWSTRMQINGQYTALPKSGVQKFSTQTRIIQNQGETYSVFPNFLVHESFNTQSEVPIVRHPTNPNIMFASANTFSGGSIFSLGVYVTTNGGATWSGTDTINTGSFNFGDPGPAIDKDGRFLISYISTSGRISNSVSTNNGVNWTPDFLIPGSSTQSDKNFSATDDAPSSPYYGRYYTVFTDFSGANFNRIVLSYSSDQGVSWSTAAPVSPGPYFQHFHQGAEPKVGPGWSAICCMGK
ncbi:MAG: exo-alpha-sialidase [Ignavibacteria bacterium]|nr:exo-alpha-sialidase [Ignavibacteria bacterium]